MLHGIQPEAVELEAFNPIRRILDQEFAGLGLVVIEARKEGFEPGGKLSLIVPSAEVLGAVRKGQGTEPIWVFMKERVILVYMGENEIQKNTEIFGLGDLDQFGQGIRASETGLHLGGGYGPITVVAGVPAPRLLIFLKRGRGILVYGGKPKGVDSDFFKVALLHQALQTRKIPSEILGGAFNLGIRWWIVRGVTINHAIDQGHIEDVIVPVAARLRVIAHPSSSGNSRGAIWSHSQATNPRKVGKVLARNFPMLGIDGFDGGFL